MFIAGAVTAVLCLAQAATGTEQLLYNDPLDSLEVGEGSTLALDVGIGSGAFHLAGERDELIYTVTDRGPNIKTKDAEKVHLKGMDGKKGKIFPVPGFTPAIYAIEVGADGYNVKQTIKLKGTDGLQISGLSNADTEAAWDINGKELDYDPDGVDAEALVKLKDGSFWIGEEYGPSLLHVAADGRVLVRWVPEGVGGTLQGADYPVDEKLPAILRARKLNRGIESIAISPDEQFLYFALQSPLAHPDTDAYRKSVNVRVFKIDRLKEEVIGEYVYTMDEPDSFVKDNAKKKRKQSDVKISEMTSVGTDKLVVLERINKTTKFYLVDLASATNIYGSAYDDVATRPSLEQSSIVELGSTRVLSKKLLFSTDNGDDMPAKIEGMAHIGGNRWIMVNDNDFGIFGDKTYLVPLTMAID